MKTAEDLIRGVLQASIRLMQFAGRLARKLTKLVAVGHMRECPKNQIRAHFRFSFTITARPELRWRRQCRRQPFYLAAFLPFQGFRRTPLVRSSNNLMRFRTMRNQVILSVPKTTRAEFLLELPDRLQIRWAEHTLASMPEPKLTYQLRCKERADGRTSQTVRSLSQGGTFQCIPADGKGQ
jgi:hypothetical protein